MTHMFMEEMPKNKQSSESRKKMQHLMWLAHERPDTSYDLSSCDCHDVPSGVYSMCKVLQKEALLLHSNKLQSLTGNSNYLADLSNIKVLDLHNNQLASLPDEIGRLLTHLQVFNVSHNKLKCLPNSISSMECLQTLILADNKLTVLPNDIHRLSNLHELDVAGNGIKQLPASLATLSRTLIVLHLDDNAMSFPPADVCRQGVESVMRYLCSETGNRYISPNTDSSGGQEIRPLIDVRASNNPSKESRQQNDATAAAECREGQHYQYEALRGQRQRDMLQHEQRQAAELLQLAQLAAEAGARRRSDAAGALETTAAIENGVAELQALKDAERRKLLADLEAEERYSAQLVADILASNEKAKNTEAILEQVEHERLLQERWFAVKAEELNALRKRELYGFMQSLFFENSEFEAALTRLADERCIASQKAQASEHKANSSLNLLLQSTAQEKASLAMDLMTQEKWQMEAVEMLLEERDVKTQRIAKEILMVEKELVRVSMLEMKSRREQTDVKQEVLAEQRRSLAQLLARLLDDRSARHKDLIHWLRDMEEQRERDQVDFWLAQLQRLLDSKPELLTYEEGQLEAAVLEVLCCANAELYVPMFAKAKVTMEALLTLGTDDLLQLGVHDEEVRRAILKNAIAYAETHDVKVLKGTSWGLTVSEDNAQQRQSLAPGVALPSVKDADVAVTFSSITLHLQGECAICMDQEAAVIFLPCGHACTCGKCSVLVSQCPMCRGDINVRLPFTA